ncbi:MAG: hypothetical protein IIW26_01410 [Tidjanibacter sp.]|nr:hypothetical protein [Tidjanibacter sp.]
MECKRYERSEYRLKVFGAAFYKKVQKRKEKNVFQLAKVFPSFDTDDVVAGG